MGFDGREPGDMPALDEVERLRAELAACASYRFRAEQEYNGVLAERDALRDELAAACELLHKLTSIIPGNDSAGKEVAEFLTARANGGGE